MAAGQIMAIGLVQLQILPEIFQSDAANFIFFSIIGCALLYIVLNRRSPLSRSIGTNSFPLGKDNLGQHVVFKYGVFELQGRRMYMEDRHFVRGLISGDPSTAMYAVYDGHGGASASEYCTEAVHRNIVNSGLLQKSTKRALRAAIRSTDEEYLRLANQKNKDDGTTATVVYCNGNDVTCANVGDSRAILVLRNGDTIPLSVDHKPNRKDERERIEALGGSVTLWGVWRVEGVLAVSRAIGDRMLKDYVTSEPEFIERTITKDDAYLIIATDGLWDIFDNRTVGNRARDIGLQGKRGVQEIAEALGQEAFSKGSTDNITILVLDLRDGPRTIIDH